MGTITVSEDGPSSRQRGCLFYFLRAVKWFGIALVAIVLLGLGYQRLATELDKRGYLPPGQIVTVNGHKMHIYCVGEGSPTVILDAGAFSYSSEWYWVQQQLAPTNRSCAYDRPGNGWSEPVSGSRDGLTLVGELHSLLTEAGITGPYVLAGHSLGGVLNRIYASQYPEEVVGLVLVDAPIPFTWPDISGYEQYKSREESATLLMSVLERTSVLRFILSNEFQGYGYPSAVATEMTALKATGTSVATWDAEVRLAQWELGQQAKAAENLGTLPVIVLWATHPEVTAPEDRAKVEALWNMTPAFSSHDEVRFAEGSDHGSILGNEQYARQVSDAILEVANTVQT